MSSAPPSVELLAGPQLLGFFLSWALQGVLSVQTYIYSLWFPRDPLSTKILVYGIFIYEWVQTVLVTQTAFEINVYNYGDRSSLTAFHNTWFSVTIMCALVSAVVQGYFCWRIYVLSRLKLLAGTIMFFAFLQMALGVSGGVMIHVIDPTAAEASKVTPVISSWLAGSAFVDVLIAVCMTYFLMQARSGIRRSDALVDRLVRLVVESGSLTATIAITDLILFTALPNTLLHECPALVLSKLYSNTLMVSLNNRAILRNLGQSASVIDSSELSTRPGRETVRQRDTLNANLERSRRSNAPLRVEVTQEDFVARDESEIWRDGAQSGKQRDLLALARVDSRTTDQSKAEMQ